MYIELSNPICDIKTLSNPSGEIQDIGILISNFKPEKVKSLIDDLNMTVDEITSCKFLLKNGVLKIEVYMRAESDRKAKMVLSDYLQKVLKLHMTPS